MRHGDASPAAPVSMIKDFDGDAMLFERLVSGFEGLALARFANADLVARGDECWVSGSGDVEPVASFILISVADNAISYISLSLRLCPQSFGEIYSSRCLCDSAQQARYLLMATQESKCYSSQRLIVPSISCDARKYMNVIVCDISIRCQNVEDARVSPLHAPVAMATIDAKNTIPLHLVTGISN